MTVFRRGDDPQGDDVTIAAPAPPLPRGEPRGGLPDPTNNDRLIHVPDEQPTIRPVARYAPDSDSDLDAVACVAGDLLFIYVTGLVEGRREVVALEIMPLPDDGEQGVEIAERMASAVTRMEATDRRSVVGTELLHRTPTGPPLEYRKVAVQEALIARVRGLIAELAAVEAPADRRDAQMAPYLPDVAAYVLAVRERISPASLIAEARDISVASANSRIARSRMFGLLTSTGRAVAAGEATPEAYALFDRLGVTPEGI